MNEDGSRAPHETVAEITRSWVEGERAAEFRRGSGPTGFHNGPGCLMTWMLSGVFLGFILGRDQRILSTIAGEGRREAAGLAEISPLNVRFQGGSPSSKKAITLRRPDSHGMVAAWFSRSSSHSGQNP